MGLMCMVYLGRVNGQSAVCDREQGHTGEHSDSLTGIIVDRPLTPAAFTECHDTHSPIWFTSYSECPLCSQSRMLKLQEDELTAAHTNTRFYRKIVVKIGRLFGEDARTSDDGSVQQNVLALKIYPLVRSLMRRQRSMARVRAMVRANPHPRKRRRYPSHSNSGKLLTGALVGAAFGTILHGIFGGRKDA